MNKRMVCVLLQLPLFYGANGSEVIYASEHKYGSDHTRLYIFEMAMSDYIYFKWIHHPERVIYLARKLKIQENMMSVHNSLIDYYKITSNSDK